MEGWKKEDYYCPYCGLQTICVEDSEGDYYVGPKYVCYTCAGSFTFQSGVVINDENLLTQLRKQL